MNGLREESLPLVGRRFWVYPAAGSIDAEDFNETFADLQQEFDPDGPGPIGVAVVTDDRDLMERCPEAIWPETELMFAGYLPDDRQLRLRYFWGATIGPGLPDSPPSTRHSRMTILSRTATASSRWPRAPRCTGEDVIALWEHEGVLPGPLARQRLQQVQLVAIAGESEVAGVSTAYLEHSPELHMDFWYYRTFVGSAHRHTNVARHLISTNRDLLESSFVSGEDTRAKGMIFELEHEGMRRHLNTALWAHSRFVFIGQNQRGWHVRVYYFPGARVPLPHPTPAD